MKCVLVLAVVLAALTLSEAKSCSELHTCLSEITNAGQVDQNTGEETCKLMNNVVACFEDALADCKISQPSMWEQQKDNIEPQMNELRSQRDDNCAQARREAKSCFGVGTCVTEMSNINQLEGDDVEEACKLMRNVIGCFEEVVADCKTSQPKMWERERDQMETQMNLLRGQINESCGSGSAIVTMSLGLMLMALLVHFF